MGRHITKINNTWRQDAGRRGQGVGMASSDQESVSNALRPAESTDVRSTEVRSTVVRWAPRALCDDISLARLGIRQTIEDEIIPRLLLSHRAPASSAAGGQLSEEQLEIAARQLGDLVEEGDRRGARAIADRLLESGLPLEHLYLRVLAPAARYLGERWEQDTTDFLRVTLGMGCLNELLRELSEELQHEVVGFASNRRILLLPTPGEAHSFGISIVAEVFRRRGWHVESHLASDCAELARLVRAEWFDVVGLSLSGEQQLQRLSEAVQQVRRASRNRRVGILVGGPQITLHPDWLGRVGADACSSDALHAVEQAEQLVGLLVKNRA